MSVKSVVFGLHKVIYIVFLSTCVVSCDDGVDMGAGVNDVKPLEVEELRAEDSSPVAETVDVSMDDIVEPSSEGIRTIPHSSESELKSNILSRFTDTRILSLKFHDDNTIKELMMKGVFSEANLEGLTYKKTIGFGNDYYHEEGRKFIEKNGKLLGLMDFQDYLSVHPNRICLDACLFEIEVEGEKIADARIYLHFNGEKGQVESVRLYLPKIEDSLSDKIASKRLLPLDEIRNISSVKLVKKLKDEGLFSEDFPDDGSGLRIIELESDNILHKGESPYIVRVLMFNAPKSAFNAEGGIYVSEAWFKVRVDAENGDIISYISESLPEGDETL